MGRKKRTGVGHKGGAPTIRFGRAPHHGRVVGVYCKCWPEGAGFKCRVIGLSPQWIGVAQVRRGPSSLKLVSGVPYLLEERRRGRVSVICRWPADVEQAEVHGIASIVQLQKSAREFTRGQPAGDRHGATASAGVAGEPPERSPSGQNRTYQHGEEIIGLIFDILMLKFYDGAIHLMGSADRRIPTKIPFVSSRKEFDDLKSDFKREGIEQVRITCVYQSTPGLQRRRWEVRGLEKIDETFKRLDAVRFRDGLRQRSEWVDLPALVAQRRRAALGPTGEDDLVDMLLHELPPERVEAIRYLYGRRLRSQVVALLLARRAWLIPMSGQSRDRPISWVWEDLEGYFASYVFQPTTSRAFEALKRWIVQAPVRHELRNGDHTLREHLGYVGRALHRKDERGTNGPWVRSICELVGMPTRQEIRRRSRGDHVSRKLGP